MSDLAEKILRKLKLKNVKLIDREDFEDPKLKKIKSTRQPVEYYWTLSSCLPLYLLDKNPKLEMVAYVDADCFFYTSPKAVYDEFGDNSILLIEHRFSPDRSKWQKTSGKFVVEFMIFRNDTNGLKALKWWRDKCIEWCFYKVEDGKLGDQMYLNDWPTRFKGVHILKHQGAGVAPWNIRNYKITNKGSRLYVDNYPLIFYHFHNLKIFGPNDFNLATGYQFDLLQKQLIYQPYLNALQEVMAQVKKNNPNFEGFVPKPPTSNRFLSLISQVKNRLVKIKA